MARPLSKEKRQAPLDAAVEFVASLGAGASTAKIAKAAGVSEGTLFTYFPTKDDLLSQLFLEIEAGFIETMLAPYPAVASAKDRLFVIWNRLIDWGLAHATARKTLRQLKVSDRVKAENRNRRHAITPNADLVWLPLDLGDLDRVRTAAEIAAKERGIDALINNAAIMNPPLTRTKQGFESQFGVNHLGVFALTSLLLPKLAQTPGSRVVVTSSIAHLKANIDWDDLNAGKSYIKNDRYGGSKLAKPLFFFELDRRLRAAKSPVTAIGVHPGVANTSLGRHMGIVQIAGPIIGLLLNSADNGAWPALLAATGKVKPGGYTVPPALAESAV